VPRICLCLNIYQLIDIIKNINVKWAGNAALLSAEVKPDSWMGEPFFLWFKIKGIEKLPSELGDPFLVGLLFPCMYEKEDLIIEAPISNSLLINISNVQDIMSNWYPELEKIKISSSIFYDSHLKNNKDFFLYIIKKSKKNFSLDSGSRV